MYSSVYNNSCLMCTCSQLCQLFSFTSELQCEPLPLCPSTTRSGENYYKCDTCDCLFNGLPQDNPEQCMNVTQSLGLCCGNGSIPINYIISTLSNVTVMEASNDKCLLGHFCFCLSRENNHVDLEDTCHLLCMSSNSTDIYTACDRVHRQFCRRHMEPGRPTKCAQMCVQDGSCVRDSPPPLSLSLRHIKCYNHS